MSSCLRRRIALSAIACAGLAVAAHGQEQVKDPGVTLEDKYSAEQLAKFAEVAALNEQGDRPNPRGPGGGDEIASASAISGFGIFDFNAGTTGTDGQDLIPCEFFFEAGNLNDVWFCWTANSTEIVTLSTCGLTTVNTKVHVYLGCEEATDFTLLACDDDTFDGDCNGEQTEITFDSFQGQTYLIQIGVSPLGGAPGVGQFEIQPVGSGGGGADDCSDPAEISGVGAFDLDTTAATSGFEFLPGGCSFAIIENDVWFCWEPEESGRYTASTCGADFDTRIAVYEFCACPPIEDLFLGCNDDNDNCGEGSDASEVVFSAGAGQQFMIQVGGANGNDAGVGQLIIDLVQGAGDDECSGAQSIGGTGTFSFDNTFATTGFDGQSNPQCDAFGTTAVNNDIWYCWTAPSDAVVRIETCDGTDLDTKIAVYDGCDCGNIEASILDCNDDACGLQSRVQFTAVEGNEYLIQFGSFSVAGFGTGTFTIEEFIPVENDECTNPNMIEGQGTFAFDNVTGTTGVDGQFDAPCPNVENDVWFCWTSDVTGQVSVQTCGGATFDTNISAYDGCSCDAIIEPLGCNDDACGLQSRMILDVVEGNQYLIQIGSWSAAANGTGSFEIEEFIPAMNDDCSNPDMIEGVGTFGFDTTTASNGPEGQNNALCDAFGSTNLNNDVWFCWTAPGSGMVTLQTCGLTGLDTRLAVYDGCACAGIEAQIIACNDDNGCALQSLLEFEAISGRQYMIQLGAFGAAQNGTGDFQIDLIETSGACCVEGVCISTVESDCLAQGGTFLTGVANCSDFDYTLEASGGAFEDITSTGTQQLLLADNSGVNVDLGFDFVFYGNTFDNVDVSDNGYLTFNGVTNIAVNSDLGVDTEPNNLIAPMWDDFDPRFCGSLHTETRGTAPNRRFIVQFTDWSEFDFIAGLEARCGDFLSTFQVVLHEGGDIEFRYADITEQRIAGDYTIGVEDEFGTMFRSINAADVVDNSSFTLGFLDPATICDDVEPACICENDGDDTRISVGDLLVYLDLWLGNDLGAELNDDGEISVQDLLIYLECYLDAQVNSQICVP